MLVGNVAAIDSLTGKYFCLFYEMGLDFFEGISHTYNMVSINPQYVVLRPHEALVFLTGVDFSARLNSPVPQAGVSFMMGTERLLCKIQDC